MIYDQGRWGVLTGASSGFGELVAQRLAGARNVACPDRAQQSRIEEVAERTRTRFAWTLHSAGLAP